MTRETAAQSIGRCGPEILDDGMSLISRKAEGQNREEILEKIQQGGFQSLNSPKLV
jgi:hypothetical protein